MEEIATSFARFSSERVLAAARERLFEIDCKQGMLIDHSVRNEFKRQVEHEELLRKIPLVGRFIRIRADMLDILRTQREGGELDWIDRKYREQERICNLVIGVASLVNEIWMSAEHVEAVFGELK